MMKFGETAQDSDLAAHLLKSTLPNAPNPLSMKEVRANLGIFFIAGHETSATSVAAALWYLARYPEIQDKAYEEVVRVCGKTESPTYEGQKELEYLTQVIYEGNRLTPPVSGLPGRITTEATELGELRLPKGAVVTVSIEALHTLEREWPDPLEFNPDRFKSDAHRNPFSWQPFGAGPRACLGRNFSVLEQRVVLAKILQAFRLCLPAGAKDSIETNEAPGLAKIVSTITLHPRIST
jgi:cytochrome P450